MDPTVDKIGQPTPREAVRLRLSHAHRRRRGLFTGRARRPQGNYKRPQLKRGLLLLDFYYSHLSDALHAYISFAGGHSMHSTASRGILQPQNRMMHNRPMAPGVHRVQISLVISGYERVEPPIQHPGYDADEPTDR